MKKHLLLSALLLLFSPCTDDPTSICNGACAEADLVVKTTTVAECPKTQQPNDVGGIGSAWRACTTWS